MRKAESYKSFYNLQRPNRSKKIKTPRLIAQQDYPTTDLATVVQFKEVIDLERPLAATPLGGQTLPVLSAQITLHFLEHLNPRAFC